MTRRAFVALLAPLGAALSSCVGFLREPLRRREVERGYRRLYGEAVERHVHDWEGEGFVPLAARYYTHASCYCGAVLDLRTMKVEPGAPSPA